MLYSSKNNMKRKFYKIIYLLVLVAGTSACNNDYLNVDPSDSVSENLVGKSIDNLYMALNGIHRKMVSQDKVVPGMGGYPGFMTCMDISADDITWENDKVYQDVLQWQAQGSDSHPFNLVMWESYYEFILNANIILSHVDKFEQTGGDLYKAVKGEALCFRAFSHFMLVQIYASRYEADGDNSHKGIPIKTEPKINVEPFATVDQVYIQINKDLDEAIGLLEGYKPKSISHFSQIVAYGLKSRVALAQHQYKVAAAASLAAINLAKSQGYELMQADQLYNGFADISTKTKEALWAALTLDDQTVNYYSFYAYMSWNFNSEPIKTGIKQINSALYNKISETDLRKKWWNENYQVRKFTARSTSNPVGNVTFMRLAELYLNYAEASILSGDVRGGKSIFMEYMLTRNPGFTLPNDQDLLDDVYNNRRVELWGEGFRFFDLKRTNLSIHREGDNFNEAFCMLINIPQSDTRWQWSIPRDEVAAQ